MTPGGCISVGICEMQYGLRSIQPARLSHIRPNGADMRSPLMRPAVLHPGSFSHVLTDITVPVAIRMFPHFPKPNFHWQVIYIPRRAVLRTVIRSENEIIMISIGEPDGISLLNCFNAVPCCACF